MGRIPQNVGNELEPRTRLYPDSPAISRMQTTAAADLASVKVHGNPGRSLRPYPQALEGLGIPT